MNVFSRLRLLILVAAGLTAAAASAQQPQIDVINIGRPTNVRALQMESARAHLPGVPVTFAQGYRLDNVNLLTRGTWTDNGNGTSTWRLGFTADGSYNLNLGFRQFYLPRTARLLIGSQKMQLRPFTAADNEVHGQLWTPPIDGNNLRLELTVANAEKSAVRLTFEVINYGFRDFRAAAFDANKGSGSCNVDVACNREPAWNDPIRSVGAITVRGTSTCSGSLVNNTAGDRRMFFLTAYHCGINPGNAASMVAIWNYQNSECRTPNSPASGGNGNGVKTQFSSGAIFRSGFRNSDFTLVELDDAADPAHGLFWAGWDHTGNESPFVVGIHHPAVLEKRISLSQIPSTTTTYLKEDVPGDKTHVRVTRWTSGTTEPGSSGSPLFDSKGRVIGQLHGGYASCEQPETSDWYGRLNVSWEGGGTPDTRLKDWLDPRNTGAPAIDGMKMFRF